MKKTNAIRDAVRYALATSAAAAVTFSVPVQAQEEDAALEEIVVTGTRIRQRDLTAISPVKSVTAEDFAVTGTTRVEDLIGNLPQAIADFGGLVSNGATGAANVDLRGLGSQRTMVLVNGRRLMPGDPTQNGGGAPDLNQIPGALIERVEVLTGGASAVYGADAVAGVVNFIMKDDFEGASLQWTRSGYNHSNGDGQIQSAVTDAGFALPSGDVTDGYTDDISFTLGVSTGDGRGNAVMYLGYREIDELLQSERDYSACALGSGDIFDTCFGSSSASPARFQHVEQTGDAAGAEIGSVTPLTPRGPNDALVPFTGDHLFNYAPFNHYQRPDERWTAGVFAHYDISDKATVYGEFQFMDDRTDAQIAPSAAFRGSGPPSLNGAYTVNCANPYLEADSFDYICTQQGLTVNDDALISIGRRLTEGGGRSNNLVHSSYRNVLGIRGDFTDNWSYDGYFLSGTTNFESTYRNDVSLDRMGNALIAVRDAQGQIVCRINADADPSNDDSLCVPIDLFHSGSDASPAAINYVSVPAFQNGSTTETVANFAISGDLTDAGVVLPSASTGLAVAFGYEYRREESAVYNDILFATGGLIGQGGATLDTVGEYDTSEWFFEGRMPLAQDKPGFQDLSIEVGYRYSDYDLGFSTDTWKVGLDWSPVDDVRFRSSLQRAVRAPNIQELFRPQGVQLAGSTDPCAVDNPGSELPTDSNPDATLANCMNTGVTAAQYGLIATNPASQYNGLTGGNPLLNPESADTFSVGLVFTPTFVENLSVTLDYFDIEIEDTIDTVGADLALNTCLTSGDPQFCSLVNRAPGSGSLWLGQQGYMIDTNQNIGKVQTSGIDLEVNWGFDLPGQMGSGAVNFIGTNTIEFVTEPLPGFPTYDCTGLFGNVCGRPAPEWGHKARFTWNTPWTLDMYLTWRHSGEVDNENTVDNSNFAFGQAEQTDLKIDSYNYIDLAGSYVFDTDLADFTIRAGINNVFDDDPPILGADISVNVYISGNTFPQNYDVLGRYWYVTLSADF
jgi:outer membrane receptor protein involved in Fe transport